MPVQLALEALIVDAEAKIDRDGATRVKEFKRDHFEREIAMHDKKICAWGKELKRLGSFFSRETAAALKRLIDAEKTNRAKVERLIAEL